MKRFRFELQRLLRLKEHAEHEWEVKLGEAIGRCRTIELEMDENRRRCGESLLARDLGPAGLGSYHSVQHFWRWMESRNRELKEELREAEERREEILAAYREASRERKVFEKLKERKERAYYRQQLKEEVKSTDDINSGRSARREVKRG